MLPAPRMALRRTSARRARGGAMVEFVLLNIVLIPLFLYAIFLMDAAYLKLDLQETVVSGVWDFSQRNTEPPSFLNAFDPRAPNPTNAKNNQNEVQGAERAVRVTYSDHTSAFDDGAENDQPSPSIYNKKDYLTGNGDGSKFPSMTGHQKHHTGFGAHYSFRFRDGPDTQFLCYMSSDTGWNPDPNFTGFAGSGYNAGAEVRCEATGFIYNYIIPESFLQEFSQVEMTKMKQRKDNTPEGVHQYQGEGGNVNNIVAFEQAGISFNTWALRNGATTGNIESRDEDNNVIGYAPDYSCSGCGDLSGADLRVPGNGVPLPVTAGSPEANPFYRRVQFLYTMNGTAGVTYGRVVRAANDLRSQADSEQIMRVLNVPPGTVRNEVLPNIIGVHVTARYNKDNSQRENSAPVFGGSYQSTPFDRANNDYQSAYDGRGAFYLGCTNQENPDCF